MEAQRRIAGILAPFLADRWLVVSAALALLAAIGTAIACAWTCDDAFISIRYAQQLLEGRGLVFNPGERVEGYTNFLWVMWIALGLGLGLSAELWANIGSIAAYAASVAALLCLHLRLRKGLGCAHSTLPFAALGAAAHIDWAIYATGGLETSAFTLLLLLGYLLITTHEHPPRMLVLAGLIFGLASLMRPDGLLPAFIVGLYLLLMTRFNLRAALCYGLPFLLLWLPFVAWRIHYYGDFFPNTYYAKSAHLTWYAQGLHFALLYFRKYWLLAVGLMLLVGVLLRLRPWRSTSAQERATTAAVALSAAIALAYTGYIIRVGGGFMFARLLIPATPFFLIVLEAGLLAFGRQRPRVWTALGAALLIGMIATPKPVTADKPSRGIVDEWKYYSPDRVRQIDLRATLLQEHFRDLHVRLAFLGGEARLVSKAKIPVAIESDAGLTDKTIARQTLQQRGRIGHEKRAPLPYLIGERKAHFVFHPYAKVTLGLAEYIPIVPVDVGGVRGLILHWDAPIMAELERRGAKFPDFPAALDRYIRSLPPTPGPNEARTLRHLEHFYFDHAKDEPRRRALTRRLTPPPAD